MPVVNDVPVVDSDPRGKRVIVSGDLLERCVTALGYASSTFNDVRFTDRDKMGPEFKECFESLNREIYDSKNHIRP